MKTITYADVVEHRPNEFSAEISELGPVESWPRRIPTSIGNRQDFVATTKKVDADGDIVYVRYLQANGCCQLKVFND